MTLRRKSLLGTLFKSLLLPGAAAVIAGVFIVFILVKEEYDELQDIGLTSKAHLLLNIFETSRDAGAPLDASDLASLLAFEQTTFEPDERTVFWFLDAGDQIIAQSEGAVPTLLPDITTEGLSTVQGHRFAAISSGGSSDTTVIVGTPMIERNEAITDILLGVILGFVLLGMLSTGAAYWSVRRSTEVIADLSKNIAEKNEHNLSPINRRNAFTEIEPAIDTLDMLMVRLDTALTAERAFATNAAHELRTPVAICLAHVQRLKTKVKDSAASASAAEIELGLKRLVRLIERLLQMSRAQSGLGINAVETDIAPVITLLLKELRDREASPERLCIKEPTGPWPSRVDPDAIGIILTNLFENALKYTSGPMPVCVDASKPGHIEIFNDCDPLTPADLEAIKHRFVRKTPVLVGFGLGLSIVQELCEQSGCTFEVTSPQQGKKRGFTAVLTLPLSVPHLKARETSSPSP